jgi:hypothetical protein
MEPGLKRDQLAEWTHEAMSIRMLDKLLVENKIDVSLPEYGGLNEQDLLFVHEMIIGKEKAVTEEEVCALFIHVT